MFMLFMIEVDYVNRLKNKGSLPFSYLCKRAALKLRLDVNIIMAIKTEHEKPAALICS